MRAFDVGAKRGGFDVDFGEAAGFEVLEVGVQLGQFAGTVGAIVAKLVERGPPGLELRFERCELMAKSLASAASAWACANASARRAVSSF